ncbi:hypothetical protein QAD02_014728 [Eretmocerus hayati]|uniref:Uncharacterized protein n=1 Tax=Eretmocerus hayati TaxID=131215 RepID=A0ACC2P7U1_9HYME|nr:hypothetical protein QAD02_014728 [Eretmocerus hayati]
MDSKEKKILDMRSKYLVYLEDKLGDLKKEIVKENNPNSESHGQFRKFQLFYDILSNTAKARKYSTETLEKFDEYITLIREKEIKAEKESRKELTLNPLFNPDAARASTSGLGLAGYGRVPDLLNDTPASPSPPHSPASHPGSNRIGDADPRYKPVVIPTERCRSPGRSRPKYSRSPTPEPADPEAPPNIVSITRINMKELSPQEWDTDESDTDAPSRPRQLNIPKPAEKQWDRDLDWDIVPPKVESKHSKARRDMESKSYASRHHHPVHKIPDDPPPPPVPTNREVNGLDQARLLANIVSKRRDELVEFVRSKPRSVSPPPQPVPPPAPPIISPASTPHVESVSSTPEQDFLGLRSPSHYSASTAVPPTTPRLLLNAPLASNRPPLQIDDLAEYLDDHSRNNLKRQQQQQQQPQLPTRPASRMGGLPGSSPVLLSPRSDNNTLGMNGLRLNSDPRSRPTDPRSHSVAPTDPRSHASTMAPSDPRSLSRYSNSYDPLQRHGYGQETAAAHPIPGAPIEKPSNVSGSGTHKMTYGYYKAQQAQQQQLQQQQQQQLQQQQQQMLWAGSTAMPHLSSVSAPSTVQATAQSTHPYQMTQTSTASHWDQQMQYPQDHNIHQPVVNGDPRMGGSAYPASNMARTTSHAHPYPPSHPTTYGAPSRPSYPSFPDARPAYGVPTYDQQHQPTPAPTSEFQRPRAPWHNNNSSNSTERFNRPNTPYRPPGPHSSWNKEPGPRPPINRDPRSNLDRDPRAAHDRDPRPPPDRDPRNPPDRGPRPPPTSTPTVPKKPPTGKEAHPNKFVKPSVPDRDNVNKKQPDLFKPDSRTNKDKEKDGRGKDGDKYKDRSKDRERDKSKHRDKDRYKDSSKTKSSEKKETSAASLYGAIDAKKAVQGSGLQKFKIPKKRPSFEQQIDPNRMSEESWDDNEDALPASSPARRESSEKHHDNAASKKVNKPSHKEKEREKDKEKEKEKSKSSSDLKEKQEQKKSKNIDDDDLISSLIQKNLTGKEQLSKDDVQGLLKNILKEYHKSKTTTDEDNQLDDKDSDADSNASLKVQKKKKTSKMVIESSDESDSDSSALQSDATSGKDGQKKPINDKSDKKKEKSKASKSTIVEKELKVALRRTIRQKNKQIPVEDYASERTETETSEVEQSMAEDPLAEIPVEAPAPKPKAKRNRELDALQEDLKTSWICDGAMKATGSRSASLKNKTQEQHIEQAIANAIKASARAKFKKPGPKSKKMITESSGSSESDDDDASLASRSEALLDSDNSSASAKQTKSGKQKPRIKNVQSMPPPLFDGDSSNDSFNLDVSAVEPSSDISLHPETGEKMGKGKSLKKGGKKTAASAAAESSSDESSASNSSSLLHDGSEKQRDVNEELLDSVISNLANDPRWNVAKRKTKKKRSSWRMGIVSKKKKKNKKAAARSDETGATEDAADQDVTNKENGAGIDRSDSLDRLSEAGSDSVVRPKVEPFDGVDPTTIVDSEALIGYTLSGNERTQCLLCTFYRKNIVHHYKIDHPGKEVLVSRLPVLDATLAIDESKALDFENNTSVGPDEDISRYHCRFCGFTTKGIDKFARESFYEHCTNHTGEYRFSCHTCNYESVTKGSMRTHFYKECRKISPQKSLDAATSEFPIPDENRVYGYLCSKCNFVQLNRSNVEKHVKMWHVKCPEDVKIYKIDMSLNVKSEDEALKLKSEVDSLLPTSKVELKDEKDTTIDSTAANESINEPSVPAEEEAELNITFETSEPKLEQKPEPAESKPEKSSNLSAFVCPVELAEKDAEIQNERKKKMQEIAQAIPYRVGQNKLSITDKLRDKIETSMSTEQAEQPPREDVVVKLNESNLAEETSENKTDPLQLPEKQAEKQKTSEETSAPVGPLNSVTEPVLRIKHDPDAPASLAVDDSANSKILDPLVMVNGSTERTEQPFSDDDEAASSDKEARAAAAAAAATQFDSDSSEHEDEEQEVPAADVSSILRDSGSPSKATGVNSTIQRLCAQLQNKSQPPPPPPASTETKTANSAEEAVRIKTEVPSPERPNAQGEQPNLLSPIRIKSEPKQEPQSPQNTNPIEDEPVNNPVEPEKPQSPKNFIRIRRISGDKLSKGNESEENTANESNTLEPPAASEPPGVINEQGSEHNFLKIENVFSIRQDSESRKVLPSIRRPIEISPQKVKGLSLLKNSPLILKCVDGGSQVITSSGETVKLIPISIPPTSKTAQKQDNFISIGGQQAVAIKIHSQSPIPTSASIANSTNAAPIKLVKVITSPEQVTVAFKLKSADVYEKMLKEDKLTHMYKCMGRDCCFSTSNEQSFKKHIGMHMNENLASNINHDEPKDFLKCAYCYCDNAQMDDLMNHLKTMHTFCRYCCRYCFYRGFADSYVELHQRQNHPGKNIHVLVVSEEQVHRPPAPKRLERKQIIKPYVCIHDCNKYFFIPEAFALHLKMHHQSIKNFVCHMCKGFSPTVDGFIEHYKQHGYFKYHCMYCNSGAPNLKDLHVHLSSCHYNQPPQVLERCLPREISKNLSAIDQLRVRDVDAMYKQSNKNRENDDKAAVPKVMKTLNPLSLISGNQSIMATQVVQPASGNPGATFVPITSLAGTVSNIRILDTCSLRAAVTPNVLNLGQNIKVTVSEAPLVLDNDAIKINAVRNEDQETSNVNEPDQPDAAAENSTPAKENPTADEDVDSDSDIEIIEEINTSQTQDLGGAGNQTPIGDFSQKIKKESSEPETNDSVVNQSSDGASVSNEPGRFLTLDDIKDTGLTGRDLYQCGVENCSVSTENAEELRSHLQQHSPAEENLSDSMSLYCVHCGPLGKKYGRPSFFIDHLKTHGLRRFSCGICNARFALQSQAQSHLRAKHKFVHSKSVPADPANPSTDGLFVVLPIAKKNQGQHQSGTPVSPEKLTGASVAVDLEKSSYGPHEIDKLPLTSIFSKAIQCAMCPYVNKVRSNMLRHLQAHLEGESVPESSPVNPVPCLEKNERMFDKMCNLASSSHENGRMGGGGSGTGGPSGLAGSATKDGAKSDEEEGLPKFVPENKRHVVERHSSDKHPEKRQFVKVIREPQLATVATKEHQSESKQSGASGANDNQESTGGPGATTASITATILQESEEQDAPDPDGNTWKCCLCEFKCVLKSAMQQHVLSVHDEKCQFKCNECGFKSVSRNTFDQHITTRHFNQSRVDFTTFYRRIKSLPPKKPDSASTPIPQAEPFDTTPLWSRDKSRIRHIRGILLEDEEEEVESTKSAKRKTDQDSPVKPAKIKSKHSSVDDIRSPEAKKARTSVDSASSKQVDAEYGKPIGDLYVCIMCTQFKTKYKHDLRDHLYRELKYLRWPCSYCDYLAVNRSSLIRHHSNKHATEEMMNKPSEINEQIEEWVATVLKKQSEIIKSNKLPSAGISMEEAEDGDGSDADELSIEVKDEDEEEVSDDEKDGELLAAPLNCKHCNMNIPTWRGFKRHVTLQHLQRSKYLCPYCDRSGNSEIAMLRHVRTKHPKQPETVKENPNTQTDDLTPEFWEREYGVVMPKSSKKRKRKDDSFEEAGPDPEYLCEQCDFRAMTLKGLKSHMRTHEQKIKLKCSYCTFTSLSSSEMREHWEMNHPHLDPKVEEAVMTPEAMDASTARQSKKSKVEEVKKITAYYCYFCEVCSISLEDIRNHWRENHAEDPESSAFKYKEVFEPRFKCAYCAEAGTKPILINHIFEKHGHDKPILLVERDEDGWMCKWCNEEFFTTKEEIDLHQQSLHEHLRHNFKVVRRVFNCKKCTFDTLSLETMQKHARVHLNFKCRFCPELFKAFYLVKNHYKTAHPDREAEHRSINNDCYHQQGVDMLVKESAEYSDVDLVPVKASPIKSPPSSPRIAKKSTTKQIAMIRPFSGKVKAVARKSTNPLPRYPSGIFFDEEPIKESPAYVSHYGRPPSPIDLSTLNITMAAGGLKMKVNCSKLAEIFDMNIEPTLKLEDIMR